MLAGANKRPHPRDLSRRASRLHCLVGDFADEDLFLNLVDGLLIHGVDPLPSFPREMLGHVVNETASNTLVRLSGRLVDTRAEASAIGFVEFPKVNRFTFEVNFRSFHIYEFSIKPIRFLPSLLGMPLKAKPWI